jgi:membrane-bound lytic murein transglycosylase A
MRWFLGILAAILAASPAVANGSFGALNGWENQNHAAALSAFQESCKAGIKPRGVQSETIDAQAWKRACAAAQQTAPADARAFFETYFTLQALPHNPESLITAYYIPLLDGALAPSEDYRWPIYAVPDDFAQPYLSRTQIEAGALNGRGLEIAWLRDPVMRFFLHIQGSGHMRLPDGRIVTLKYAAKNGLPYTAIGKVLIEREHLTRENVSLQSIRDYLYAHPEQQAEIMNHNDSYVFFSLDETGAMPVGAQGVPLTPEHSLAIDPAHWPYGLPVYIEVQAEQPFSRLVITQDTGSAIRGAQRADWFAGLGADAEAKAGGLAAQASWYRLVPKP